MHSTARGKSGSSRPRDMQPRDERPFGDNSRTHVEHRVELAECTPATIATTPTR